MTGGVIDTGAGGATLSGASLTLNNTGSFVVTDGFSLTIAGTINNTGTFTLQAGDPTDLDISGNTTLSGTGKVTFAGSGNNHILSNGSAATLTNVGNTISGAGSIGAGNLTLVNQAKGIINATGTNALVLNTGSNAISNAGILEATGAGGLLINGVTINNASTGIIEAMGTLKSHVDLEGATINAGKVTTAKGDMIDTAIGSAQSTITGATVTNAGTLEANSNSTLLVQGGKFSNTGSLVANGNGSVLDVTVADGAGTGTIFGTGKIELGAGSTTKITFDSLADGTLKLDQSILFKGNVSGLTANDTLDLGDINFATVHTPTFSGTATGGTLTVTDGTHTAKIALLGNYLASTWTTSSDGHGGTFVIDPPSSSQQAFLSSPHHHA
jgi:large repetitive protein